MNLEHLGDALDYWKGGLIEMLDGLLRDLHVIPLFTDDPTTAWTQDHLRLYARLLSVPRDRILACNQSFQNALRQEYFAGLSLPEQSDLFLDPDTGIAPNHGGNAKHIRLNEIAGMLPAESRRILLVYQHAFRKHDYVTRALHRVVDSDQLRGTSAFAYLGGAASMIFITRAKSRLNELHRRLAQAFERPVRITDIK